ncbi:hypothetical protein CHLNCDRAFT_134482 [Chlorella variabilis]|uniref:DAGKc domain-containing protein n=1 Tax=Chlorella variabilis TaxID=554065 RepID=E1ZG31_CHLVA|nr:hypothetical protein CHLNCDRAFT_134482 [Chlorella variabilis]EFN55392.1 hypothetical protein CHLNCDRAFT_134482 [Chlorella variabilis]|eukprot:XP_005847494.1 hypothetical protein CHLNCDRAFT_134482 [Chlorella variabilis]
MANLLQRAASEASPALLAAPPPPKGCAGTLRGVDIVSKLSNVCKSRYQCPPLSPSYIQEAKAIILMRGTKAGKHDSRGTCLLPGSARRTTGSEPPHWSAPVFIKVTVGQVGFIMGFEQVSHTVLGVDQSMVVLQSEVEDKSDVIAASSGSADLVGISHSSGVMLDFSLSGGSMSVNQSKMEQAYGSGVTVADVVKGVVPPPAELAPLYDKLAELVVVSEWYDPERRIGAEASLASMGYGAAPAAMHPRAPAGGRHVTAAPLGNGPTPAAVLGGRAPAAAQPAGPASTSWVAQAPAVAGQAPVPAVAQGKAGPSPAAQTVRMVVQREVKEASSSCPAFLLGLFKRGAGPPPQIPAADIIGATASGCELVIWHAPLQGKAAAAAEKPARRLRRTPPLVLESSEQAAAAVALVRAACCAWGSVYRPPRLLVIVNPASGPGRAPSIYEKEVRPALEAAGCQLAMHLTKATGHATELVRQVEPGSVDAVVAIGGDGTMYEALQASAWLPCEIEGMLMRPDWDAMRHAPLAQIPCGSGNALAASVGMWTVHTAVHAVVKGQRRALDIASGKLPPRTAGPGATLEWARAHERRCFSFLSINFGLITNLDIGTEHLRWMGGTRFVVGALQQIMLKRTHAARVAVLAPDSSDGVAADGGALDGSGAAGADGVQNGSHAAHAGLRAAAALSGPPVQHLDAFLQLAGKGRAACMLLPNRQVGCDRWVVGCQQLPPGWQWLPDPRVALFTATNLPRLDMNFHLAPMAAPDTGCFDLVYTAPGSRREGLQFMTASEKGQHMGLPTVRHRRVAAMALEPQSTGTWLVVDGEVVPFSPLFMEVHPSLCSALVVPAVR